MRVEGLVFVKNVEDGWFAALSHHKYTLIVVFSRNV